MGLKKQCQVNVVQSSAGPLDVKYLFESILETKSLRRGLKTKSSKDLQDWKVQVHINGPYTFCLVTTASGAIFTGVSKFNPNDDRYSEFAGVARCLQQACDRYLDTQHIISEEYENVAPIRVNSNPVPAHKELE